MAGTMYQRGPNGGIERVDLPPIVNRETAGEALDTLHAHPLREVREAGRIIHQWTASEAHRHGNITPTDMTLAMGALNHAFWLALDHDVDTAARLLAVSEKFVPLSESPTLGSVEVAKCDRALSAAREAVAS